MATAHDATKYFLLLSLWMQSRGQDPRTTSAAVTLLYNFRQKPFERKTWLRLFLWARTSTRFRNSSSACCLRGTWAGTCELHFPQLAIDQATGRWTYMHISIIQVCCHLQQQTSTTNDFILAPIASFLSSSLKVQPRNLCCASTVQVSGTGGNM